MNRGQKFLRRESNLSISYLNNPAREHAVIAIEKHESQSPLMTGQ